jgi:hypothetical protein
MAQDNPMPPGSYNNNRPQQRWTQNSARPQQRNSQSAQKNYERCMDLARTEALAGTPWERRTTISTPSIISGR